MDLAISVLCDGLSVMGLVGHFTLKIAELHYNLPPHYEVGSPYIHIYLNSYRFVANCIPAIFLKKYVAIVLLIIQLFLDIYIFVHMWVVGFLEPFIAI